MRPRRWRATVLLAAGGLLAAVPQPGLAQAPGTVATVAGPGLCAGAGVVDPSSTAVRSLAVDGSGTIFFSTAPIGEGALARVDADGRARLIRTGVVAEGDFSVAADRAGGVYLGTGAGVVVVGATDSVAFVAGDPRLAAEGRPASAGDGGPAALARFTAIVSLASDESGNIYVADQNPSTALHIRFVNRGAGPVTFYPGSTQELVVQPGYIDTIAGGGRSEGAVAGSALAATLSGGSALAVMPGRIYVAVDGSGRAGAGPGPGVMMVNLTGAPLVAHGVTMAAGAIGLVAGGAPAGYGGDGGPALAASFSRLSGMAADGTGRLVVADETNHRVRKVDADGSITTLAGTGPVGTTGGGFNGNDRAATGARLNHPFGVATGPGGRVYMSDRQNHQVRYVDADGVIRAARGNEIGLSWDCAPDDASPAGRAGVAIPPMPGRLLGVAADDQGNLYVASESLQQVKRRDSSGNITTVAGGDRREAAPCRLGPACATGDGEPAARAVLKRPAAVAIGPEGGLYILDAGDARLRFVNLGSRPRRVHGVTVTPGTIQTVAGTGVSGTDGDGGPALAAQLSAQPYSSVAADSRGNVFLTDRSDRPSAEAGRIRRIDAEGIITTVVRGPGEANPSGCCYSPAGLTVDPAGNLYVTDMFVARRVWFLNVGSATASVHGRTVVPGASELVAGAGPPGFGGDGGPAIDAHLETPVSLALDRSGNLYVADLTDNSVRQVDVTGRISTIVGTGTSGFNGDGLKGPLTSLASPIAVAVDRCDNLLVADQANDRVRRLQLADSCARAVIPSAGGRPYQRLGLWVLLASCAGAAALWITLRARGLRRKGSLTMS